MYRVLVTSVAVLMLTSAVSAQDTAVPSAAGDAAGPGLAKSFLGEFLGSATHREEVRLDVGGESGQSTRMALNLRWSLQTPRTALRASLGPYFETFSDGGLSTFGGSAGLGLEQQSSARQVWNLSGTVLVAPEQDVQPPQVAAQPQAPRFTTLVPRNGFIAIRVGGGVGQDISPKSSFDLGFDVSRTEYDAFDVDDGASARANLADRDSLGVNTSFSHQVSVARAWDVGVAARRTSLSGGVMMPGDGADDRDQVSVTTGISQQLRAHSIAAEVGFGRVDAGEVGTAGTLLFDGAWNWTGERSGTNVALRRSQEVFAGERVTIDETSIVGAVSLLGRRRSAVNLGASYGISERSAGGAGDVRNRSVSAAYRWQGPVLGWSASVLSGRQRTDAGFARNQDTTDVSVSLIWRFAGAGGPA